MTSMKAAPARKAVKRPAAAAALTRSAEAKRSPQVAAAAKATASTLETVDTSASAGVAASTPPQLPRGQGESVGKQALLVEPLTKGVAEQGEAATQSVQMKRPVAASPVPLGLLITHQAECPNS